MARFKGFFKDLTHVLSSLTRDKPGKRLCPVCGSPEIRLSSGWSGWLTPEQFSCAKCGYSGPIVMEVSAPPTQLKTPCENAL